MHGRLQEQVPVPSDAGLAQVVVDWEEWVGIVGHGGGWAWP